MKWNNNHLVKLVRDGKIKGFSAREVKTEEQEKPGSRQKAWIDATLHSWCDMKGLKMETEWRFHDERKWRFDWAVPELKLAVEYEGLMSEKSGHTTIKGFTKDTEKYNAAGKLGWTVLRYTAINYKNLMHDLNYQQEL